MFFPEGQVRVHLYGQPVDMRRSIDGLYALTRHELGQEEGAHLRCLVALPGLVHLRVALAFDAALQALVDPSWGCVLGRQLEVSKDYPGARLQLVVDYLLKHWDGTQSLVEPNRKMCSDLAIELVDRTAAAETVRESLHSLASFDHNSVHLNCT